MSFLASFPRRTLKFIIIAGLLEKGYLFILVNLPERIDKLDVANVPQETLLSSCASVDDVHRDSANSSKPSEKANDDRTNNDSFHNLFPF